MKGKTIHSKNKQIQDQKRSNKKRKRKERERALPSKQETSFKQFCLGGGSTTHWSKHHVEDTMHKTVRICLPWSPTMHGKQKAKPPAKVEGDLATHPSSTMLLDSQYINHCLYIVVNIHILTIYSKSVIKQEMNQMLQALYEPPITVLLSSKSLVQK